MSDAVSVSVAKGVVTHLVAQNLSIEPKRSYADWELALEDQDVLHVDVVAHATEQEIDQEARGGKLFYLIPLFIAVRKRFGSIDQEDREGRVNIDEIDKLVLLTQNIHESMTQKRLTDFNEGVWQATRTLVVADPKSLQNNRQFLSVIRSTFRVTKSIA